MSAPSELPEDYGTAIDYIFDTAFPDSHPFMGQAISELEELRTDAADFHRLKALRPQFRKCIDCAAWVNPKPHICRLGECHRRSPQEIGDEEKRLRSELTKANDLVARLEYEARENEKYLYGLVQTWNQTNKERNAEIEKQNKTIGDLRNRLEASEVKYLKLLNEYRERTRN